MKRVNVYRIERHYSGSEEGGWWYDVFVPEKSVPARGMAQARAIQLRLSSDYPNKGHRYSMRPPDNDYSVRIEDRIGREYHDGRSWYE